MDTIHCNYPLVAHRFTDVGPTGRTTRRVIVECPDPDCNGDRRSHDDEVPCRWAWQLAHGKTVNG